MPPFEKQLPIGSGKEFLDERKKETLPAIEVKNTVLWVNPAFKEAPFKLEIGKPTKLGIFFTPEPDQLPEKRTQQMIIMPEWGKGRSGMLESVIFKDNQGNLYRDVDLKGIGGFRLLRSSTGLRSRGFGREEGHGPKEAFGLMDLEFAERDRIYSEKFIKAGIRTHGVIAIIELEELIDENGKPISVEEAKDKKLISDEMQPVIEVRAFGTKERVDYLNKHDVSHERIEATLKDARMLVAQELNIDPNSFSNTDYLKWFAKTLGNQVARIRKLKLHHGYLTGHNITLDCRIVDLDSVDEARLKDEKGKSVDELYREDYQFARSSLHSLRGFLLDATTYSNEEDFFLVESIFKKAYDGELATKRKRISKKTNSLAFCYTKSSFERFAWRKIERNVP